ncbi:mitochondrial metalloendopeptidase Oma1p [[Candida] jaroonii]|uniref:Mitochondrial metalloendopeptidase Oma1p n=1 Tax=[Candida] jaroonii TaxID=467808 RepID=A0ACA9Y970_9ASCO|nr:mitochondrial metalloendopeptidase Oma1p [[Candida] jaroonii]
MNLSPFRLSTRFSTAIRPLAATRPLTATRLYSRGNYKRFNQQSTFNYQTLFTNRYFGGTILGLLGFYLYNQDEAPYTKRRRFLWIPSWLELRIGDMSYQQIYLQYRSSILPKSDPIYREIRGIVDRLLKSAFEHEFSEEKIRYLKSLDWEINIINDNSPPNAFILPNGKIFIFSSILGICKDTDGIATVLSHELSHQLASHSMEQMSKQPIYMALSTFLYLATGISYFNDLLIAGFFQMPASREMESEADRIGCELMAKSCFDIYKIPGFWERMNSLEKKQAPRFEFLSTHPNNDKRIRDIKSWMGDLENIRESSNCNQLYNFFSM